MKCPKCKRRGALWERLIQRLKGGHKWAGRKYVCPWGHVTMVYRTD